MDFIISNHLFIVLIMNKKLTITWLILIILTVGSALISRLDGRNYIVLTIMLFAVFKFIGIAFQFMELKKAHTFWKVLILSYLTLFITLILAIA